MAPIARIQRHIKFTLSNNFGFILERVQDGGLKNLSPVEPRLVKKRQRVIWLLKMPQVSLGIGVHLESKSRFLHAAWRPFSRSLSRSNDWLIEARRSRSYILIGIFTGPQQVAYRFFDNSLFQATADQARSTNKLGAGPGAPSHLSTRAFAVRDEIGGGLQMG